MELQSVACDVGLLLKLDRPLSLIEVQRIGNCIGEAVSYLSV